MWTISANEYFDLDQYTGTSSYSIHLSQMWTNQPAPVSAKEYTVYMWLLVLLPTYITYITTVTLECIYNVLPFAHAQFITIPRLWYLYLMTITKFLAMCSIRCDKPVKCEILGSFAYRSSKCIILPHMTILSLINILTLT